MSLVGYFQRKRGKQEINLYNLNTRAGTQHKMNEGNNGWDHIFLPSFAHIISITHAGLIDPCVIGIIFHKLRSKYMRKQMVDFNALISNIYFDRSKDLEGHNCCERMFNMTKH